MSDLYLDHNPAFPVWLLIAALIAMAVFSWWTYPPGTPRRRTLLTLRFLAILIALLALFRPSLVFVRKTKQPASLVILGDASKSMLLKDMWNDQSRWQALGKVLGDAEPELANLKDLVEIKRFQFGRRLQEGLETGKLPEADQTAIGDALEQLMERVGDERVAGIVLLSDGTNTVGSPPSNVVRQLSARGIPVYAFGFGQEVAGEQVKDLAAVSLSANPVVFAKNRTPIRGEFAASGLAGRKTTVRLLFDDKEQKRQVLEIGPDGTRMPVDLVGTPTTSGDMKVTLESEVQPGELLASNNKISTWVTVLSGGINVLQLEGKYRFWEPKYVRWALDQSPDIDLTQEFLLLGRGNVKELPDEQFRPGKVDVYLLGDLAASQLPPAQIAKLAEAVERGAGLLVMGGYQSFGPGGWNDTPLGRVLPVVMRAADPRIETEAQLLPTEAGNRHFVLRQSLDTRENDLLWKSLRPLDGVNAWSEVKPNGLVLARAADNRPLIAVSDYGAGRVMAFAGDTTWRWRKTPQGRATHARFWRQLILWLAKKDEQGDARVKLELDRRRLAVGQRLNVVAAVENADGTPVTAASIKVSVVGPDGRESSVDMIRDGNVFRGAFAATDQIGDYTARAVAVDGPKEVGTRSARFLTYQEDNESRQIAADHGTLKTLATGTGGEFLTPEKLPEFVKSLRNRELNLEVPQTVKETLWDRWEPLVLFIALLTAEWIIRKRGGLV